MIFVHFSNDHLFFGFETCTLFKSSAILVALISVHFSKGGCMGSGGSRPGSGRKKGIPTTAVRVPNDIYYFVKILSRAVKESPGDFEHLFDSDKAGHMLHCLSTQPPLAILNAAMRYKRRPKNRKKYK